MADTLRHRVGLRVGQVVGRFMGRGAGYGNFRNAILLGIDDWPNTRSCDIDEHVDEWRLRERIAEDIEVEEPKIRGFIDFDRHRESCIGQINGLRRAAKIVREGR